MIEEKKEFILGTGKWGSNRQMYFPKIIGENLGMKAGESEVEYLVGDRPNEIRLRRKK